VLRALTDRGLIEEAGRDEGPGRPLLYGTTPQFLERLGLPSLAALPSLAPLLSGGAADLDDAADLAVRGEEADDGHAGAEPVEPGDG
jgi:segregation and condensation protein B